MLGTLFEVNGTPFVVIAAAIDAEGNKRLRELRMILLAVFVTSIFISPQQDGFLRKGT